MGRELLQRYLQEYQDTRGSLLQLERDGTLQNDLVPLSEKAFVRGKLAESADVMVLLGGDQRYFAEVGVRDAVQLIDRRIQQIESLIVAESRGSLEPSPPGGDGGGLSQTLQALEREVEGEIREEFSPEDEALFNSRLRPRVAHTRLYDEGAKARPPKGAIELPADPHPSSNRPLGETVIENAFDATSGVAAIDPSHKVLESGLKESFFRRQKAVTETHRIKDEGVGLLPPK